MAEEKKGKTKRPTPLKRDLQNEKRRIRNKAFRAKTLTAVRAFERSLTGGDATAVSGHLSTLYSLMDKGVKTGIYKLNQAARVKARLSARTRRTTA
jgi:small subunit ribosomal protein S20